MGLFGYYGILLLQSFKVNVADATALADGLAVGDNAVADAESFWCKTCLPVAIIYPGTWEARHDECLSHQDFGLCSDLLLYTVYVITI